MKDTVTRIISYRFDHYEEIEAKLEKMAAKGLFLKEYGIYLWTFRKGTPQQLKYTVTYFSEGSIYNPDITDNQQAFLDYAEAAGWNFVTQSNQMQIFCSKADNPIPFETDEGEKFKNIKKCMWKNFIPSTISLISIFTLNLILRFLSFQRNPVEFFSSPTDLIHVLMLSSFILFNTYSLLDYFLWCKRSKKSINNGGTCLQNKSHRVFDIFFLIFIFISLGVYLFYTASQIGWGILLIAITQIPIMIFVFQFSIKYLKKKKTSAAMNKTISTMALAGVGFLYFLLLFGLIMHLGFDFDRKSPYRTVTWPITNTYSEEYKLYNDELPLTCEDLYGPVDYDYYSYEKREKRTFFLSNITYQQTSLPAKGAPPRIEYTILEPHFNFIYQLTKEHLFKIPIWQTQTSLHAIDNKTFGTIEAYQRYYNTTPMGEYILFFPDKIVTLNLEEPPTVEQILTIREKLTL